MNSLLILPLILTNRTIISGVQKLHERSAMLMYYVLYSMMY